jgi:hypothetical protein
LVEAIRDFARHAYWLELPNRQGAFENRQRLTRITALSKDPS